jgi:hypothetical protein
MPPAFMPSRGIAVRNSQLSAPIPRTTIAPITKRMGTPRPTTPTTSSVKPRPLNHIAAGSVGVGWSEGTQNGDAGHQRNPPRRRFWKMADAAARLIRNVMTKEHDADAEECVVVRAARATSPISAAMVAVIVRTGRMRESR